MNSRSLCRRWPTIVCLAGVLTVCCACSAIGKTAKGIHPVIMAETYTYGLLMGGTMNGKWLSMNAISRRLHSGQKYRFYSDKQFVAEKFAAAPKPLDGHFMVAVRPEGSVGIAGDWNAMPRKAKADRTDRPVYRKIVGRVLRQHHLGNVPVNIDQVVNVDLEGDGHTETLISAKSTRYITYERGDYSFVLLSRSPTSTARTLMLCSEFHTKKIDNGYPEYYDIHGFWDVDGDGTLEVGVSFSCQRADVGGLSLYKLKKNKVRLLAMEGLGH